MKTRWIRLCLVVASLSAAAFAQDVKYNFDPSADFSKYKTYRWEQHPDSLKLDNLTLRQLGEAFDAELATKGLKKATGPTSDLVIVYQLAISQEKELTTFDSGYAYGPRWGYGYGGAYGGGISTTTTSTITIGGLALDMYDTSTKQIIWRGTASKTLDAKAKPDKQQKNMAKAAKKMLKNYPPPKKK